MTLIGIDFSINKPAACVLHNNKYHFYGWPYDLKPTLIENLRNADVNIINRNDIKGIKSDISEKMRTEIKNSIYLANLIISTLQPFLSRNTYLAFEGLSYGSSGDVVLQLSGYKYILMSMISNHIPIENIFTYSPITIKATAECSKRGMTKNDMIDKFVEIGPNQCKFRMKMYEFPERFQTPRSKKWTTHIDDLVDAYFTLKTLEKKEGF